MEGSDEEELRFDLAEPEELSADLAELEELSASEGRSSGEDFAPDGFGRLVGEILEARRSGTKARQILLDARAAEARAEAITSYVAELLDELSERERTMVATRFGLTGGGKRTTLEECGAEFDLTKQRAGQILKRVTARLRHPTKVRRLESLLKD